MHWLGSIVVSIAIITFGVAGCGGDGGGAVVGARDFSAGNGDFAVTGGGDLSGGGGDDLSTGGGDLARGGGPVDCTPFAPCMGDPTGTWQYAGECGSTDLFCQGATYD